MAATGGTTDTTTTASMPAEGRAGVTAGKGISRAAARLSFASAAAFLLLLAALHLVKPELDPSWRVISEYAIGDQGWMMGLAFLALALSCVALCIAIGSQVRTVAGYIGLALLLVSAAGMAMAGIFTTDPLTAGEGAATAEGKLHEVGAMLDMIPIAATLIGLSLRRHPAWSSARRPLLWTAVLVWIGFVGFMASLGIMLSRSGGRFGPDVLIGWPNRLLVVTYCVWLMTVAWHAARPRG